MDCEIWFPKIAARGTRMMRAMIEAAPVNVTVTQTYQGKSPLLMAYGLGHVDRKQYTDAHVASGGRLIGWDMGYWNREQAMRCTVDAGHPKFMPDMPADRWDASGIRLRNDFDPDGPIILIGMGVKSRRQFGFNGQQWELDTLAAIRAAYPGMLVLYRPKKPERLADCPMLVGSIESEIRGASLVVCRHSNVAVDACIAGIPVVCWDGAAKSLYGSTLSSPVNPTESERLQFLHNLAYWQWLPTEAKQAWSFLLRGLGST